MDILLLGGSNAGLRDGWAAQFMEIAAEHRVTNQFLGATGSLFGLLRLFKREQDKAAKPDLIVFEYALNDMILLEGHSLGKDVVRDTLDEVAQYCAEHRIKLLFLVLQPRDAVTRSFSAAARVTLIYARIARMRSMFPCLTLPDILAASPSEDCYQDPYHLTRPVSRLVAEAVWSTLRNHEIPTPLAAPACDPAFAYISATKARTLGPARLRQRESKVFKGLFLEIGRSGVSYWPGRGRLVALMLRSSETAGVYQLKNSTLAYRKCAASLMQQTVAKLVVLHYLSRPFYVDDDLEISMPVDEAVLLALQQDKTLQEAEPLALFPEQWLEINGVMLWRPPPPWTRWRRALTLSAHSCRAKDSAPEALSESKQELRQ